MVCYQEPLRRLLTANRKTIISLQSTDWGGPARMFEFTLICCKVYISECNNAAAIAKIEEAAKQYPEAVIITKFKDEAYNRTRFTLVSRVTMNPNLDASPLKNAVLSMVKAAIECINLEQHCGTHPRLGVVDDISFHPLAQASMEQASEIARSVALDIGHKLQMTCCMKWAMEFEVPAYLYGAADKEGKTLVWLRRELGYFTPNSDGNQWRGGLTAAMLPLKPDAGPLQPSPAKGIVAIGAMSYVGTYNVPVRCTDVEAVRMIAKKVSERGGGLKSVQAIGALHGEDCIEVACYLLDPRMVGADQVQREVRRFALEEGFEVEEGYSTDLLEENIIEEYFKSMYIMGSL